MNHTGVILGEYSQRVDHRITQLEESLSQALGYLPELQIATSVVVVLAVLVWMIMMGRREDVRVRRPKVTATAPRRIMAEQTSTPTFTIRWGRTAIFAVAVLATLVFIVTAVAGLFGAAMWAWALLSLVVSVASLASLRALAIRDQYRRADAQRHSERPATTVEAGSSADTDTEHDADRTPESSAKVEHNHPVFDRQAQAGAVAERTTDEPGRSEEQDHTPLVELRIKEAPVPKKSVARRGIPRPMYLDAAEIVREQPEPLATEVTPQPSADTHLKDGVSPQYQAKVTAKAHRKLDLDKVLDRRRAI
ncbi:MULTISPECIES: UbiA family prenyltransferase [Auritidibacter]|uniref:UbiA family prenyltransferase n=1 Tax=Auritidibacter TaxID=1160973 RepID=UPI000D73886C|nr:MULTISPECIES: UbiA family prenyltransferase [Auritidibacter]AXR73071.1 hypothetical protein DCC27_000730 [Auritidibacter sp. NML130574]PXA81825.1 hypothetical protein DCC25_00060 [Auritidibacter sp. NML120636]WGH81610.1 UbiA family prenyltransferase [Auritidibacter ignavus]WGH83873.1 UbiA family prenyltransferase [Auritidibacter ignavus]